MTITSAYRDMRWIFDDPTVRRIKHDLREGAKERRQALAIKTTIGVVAATSTFFAGLEVLGLGTATLQLTQLQLTVPLLQALAMH